MPSNATIGVVCGLLLQFIWTHPSAAEKRAIPSTQKAAEPYIERIVLRHKQKDRDLRNQERACNLEMIYLPSGQFIMGSSGEDKRHEATELPPHEVEVSAFWMAKFEITWALFDEWIWAARHPDELPDAERKFFISHPFGTPWTDPDLRLEHHPDYAAAGFTQYCAQQFCRWLSVRTGQTYRLPTEAEWEYAARAGTRTDWHFGDDARLIFDYAWCELPLKPGSYQVGQKKPNQWGLHDMYGNVAEWTLDGWSEDYREFAGKVTKDPWVRRPARSRVGVVRGGDWTTMLLGTRSATRQRHDDTQANRWITTGFGDFDVSDEGRRVGFRVVSPQKADSDNRAIYLKRIED